jgi:hypothetical protein
MNIRDSKKGGSFLLMVILLIVTACGTLEVSTEPEVSITEASVAATEVSQPTPVQVVEEAVTVEPANTPPAEDTVPTVEATPAPTEPPAEEEDQVETAQPVTEPSEITMLDETWFNYTNYQHGFSINFPRTKIHFMGSCKWNEENGDRSYRPDPSHVPVKIFEDGDTVYITSEYQHELSGETRETDADGGTRIFFSECLAVSNTLELLRDPESYQEMWEIVAKEVHSDEELEGFLKDRYGSSCSLGDIVASEQNGVFDVRVRGDGKDLSETQCPLNFGTVIKYYPEGNKVIAWDTGQAYTFPADVTNSVTYDQDMVNSFRYLTGTSNETVMDLVGDDYSGWELYTNGAVGYSLMYPGEAEISESNHEEMVEFIGPMVDNEHWHFSVQHFDDEFFRPPAGTDVRDWLADRNIPYDPLAEEVTIGGLPAVRLSSEASPQAYARDDYYVINGDQLFAFSVIHGLGLQDWALFEQFLQSITFEPVQ